MQSAKDLIAAERQRQISQEGYTPEADQQYTKGQLEWAGDYYAAPAEERIHLRWPWAMEYFKPTPDNRVRELVKAGALYQAEKERLMNAGQLTIKLSHYFDTLILPLHHQIEDEKQVLLESIVDELAAAPGFSLLQPWASLAAHGYKQMETRGQNSYHRGATLIHASKGKSCEHRELCETDPYIKAALAEMGKTYDSLPRGVIVGVYTQGQSYQVLNPVYRERDGQNPAYLDAEAVLSQQERAMGDYTPGRYTYEMKNARPLREPVHASGALSFWKVPPEVRTLVAADLILSKLNPSPIQ